MDLRKMAAALIPSDESSHFLYLKGNTFGRTTYLYFAISTFPCHR